MKKKNVYTENIELTGIKTPSKSQVLKCHTNDFTLSLPRIFVKYQKAANKTFLISIPAHLDIKFYSDLHPVFLS